MKETIQHERYGQILYDENFWTGKKSLSMGGVLLNKISRKEFQLPDGTIGTIKGTFLYGACLLINGESIRLTPKITWYEIVLCILPFLLVMVWGNTVALCKIIPIAGGAIGGAVSAILSCVGLYLMRSVKEVWAKILIGISAILVTFGICCGIGFAILISLT